MNNFSKARRKYRPDRINLLFIAEAPPSTTSNRFFYFGSVRTGDSLFLEIMKVLYKDDFQSIKELRKRKPEFLKRFKEDGFYLIDACDEPMNDNNAHAKIKRCREALPFLIKKLKKLATKETSIILISKSVFEACLCFLKENRFNILNKSFLPFPGSGQQKIFRRKLSRLI